MPEIPRSMRMSPADIDAILREDAGRQRQERTPPEPWSRTVNRLTDENIRLRRIIRVLYRQAGRPRRHRLPQED